MCITLLLSVWFLMFDGGAVVGASYVENIKSISLSTVYHIKCVGMGSVWMYERQHVSISIGLQGVLYTWHYKECIRLYRLIMLPRKGVVKEAVC